MLGQACWCMPVISAPIKKETRTIKAIFNYVGSLESSYVLETLSTKRKQLYVGYQGCKQTNKQEHPPDSEALPEGIVTGKSEGGKRRKPSILCSLCLLGTAG